MSWQEEIRSALKTPEQLEDYFEISIPQTNFTPFIPLKIAQKIKDQGLDGPLAKQFLPSIKENEFYQATGLYDPIADKKHSPTPQLVHRYKNRVLFFPTQACPIHCRYCFRQNELQEHDSIFHSNFKNTIEYLKEHKEIEEVIFSGGDPLMLSDEKLEYYLEEFTKIPHIQFFRFHTRTPIILPARINKKLANLPVTYVLHINHASEWDDEVSRAIKMLSPRVVLSQSVLLKGVNDSVEDLSDLFRLLGKNQVVPYYLHHPDPVQGGMHFRLSTEEGLEIYQGIRKELPGWCVPKYVVEGANGGGKVLVQKG